LGKSWGSQMKGKPEGMITGGGVVHHVTGGLFGGNKPPKYADPGATPLPGQKVPKGYKVSLWSGKVVAKSGSAARAARDAGRKGGRNQPSSYSKGWDTRKAREARRNSK
jgi:hypothetical protein